jgi:hypothetical protein
MLSNKEKAILTYKALKKREERNTRKAEQDVKAISINNMARVYKKNYKNKRRGQP